MCRFQWSLRFLGHSVDTQTTGRILVECRSMQMTSRLVTIYTCHIHCRAGGRRQTAPKGNVSVGKTSELNPMSFVPKHTDVIRNGSGLLVVYSVASCSFHAADSCGFTCLASSLRVSSNSTVTPRCVARCRARLGWPELRQTTREPTVFQTHC